MPTKIVAVTDLKLLYNSGHYITNPNNALSKEMPQIYHTFALSLIIPKWVPFHDPCTKQDVLENTIKQLHQFPS